MGSKLLLKKYFQTNQSVIVYNKFRLISTSKVQHDKQENNALPPKTFLEKVMAPFTRQIGRINALKPIRVVLNPNTTYLWCRCGLSGTQPFCSGAHMNVFKNKAFLIPKIFRVQEEKEYSLCVCKRTKRPPFCDGTHKRPEIIQEFQNQS